MVLLSSARVYRNVAAIPFPRSPRAPSCPSRLFLADTMLSLGGWSSVRVCRARAGDPALPLRAWPRPAALCGRRRGPRPPAPRDGSTFALLDEIDHLRIRVHRLLDSIRNSSTRGRRPAELIGEAVDFARRPGIGWICSRLSDCGLGASLSATSPYPGLGRGRHAGPPVPSPHGRGVSFGLLLRERGILWLRVRDRARWRRPSVAPTRMVAVLSSTLAKVVAAERRARDEIAATGRGRPRGCRGQGLRASFATAGLLGAEEAASLVSVLRLASLARLSAGAEPGSLGVLLLSLGRARSPDRRACARCLAAAVDALRADSSRRARRCRIYDIEEGA